MSVCDLGGRPIPDRPSKGDNLWNTRWEQTKWWKRKEPCNITWWIRHIQWKASLCKDKIRVNST